MLGRHSQRLNSAEGKIFDFMLLYFACSSYLSDCEEIMSLIHYILVSCGYSEVAESHMHVGRCDSAATTKTATDWRCRTSHAGGRAGEWVGGWVGGRRQRDKLSPAGGWCVMPPATPSPPGTLTAGVVASRR